MSAFFTRTLLLASLFLSACASTVLTPTDIEDRDANGTYDGNWRVIVSKGAGIQYIGNWNFTCADMSQEINFAIRDSTIRLSSDASDATAYVSPAGKFKLSLPLASESSSSGNSDVTLNNAQNTLILTGVLSEDSGKGRFTIGIAEFSNAGCTAPAKFEKIPFQLET